MDLAFRGHQPSVHRLDAGTWIHSLALGPLQRIDDDVPAGHGIHLIRSKGVWLAWKRTIFEYDGLRYIGSFAPLFVHQYSQAWFDFRDKRDQYADYFQNSVIATEVHRRFCLEINVQFSDYSNALWGITASDSAQGYVVWGGPPAMGPIDGTIVPAAAGGSLPFLPGAPCGFSEPFTINIQKPGAATASSMHSILDRVVRH